jgi:serine/threonine-protein kinase RsbW
MISEKIQLVIPSVPNNIHQIERFVEDICDEYNINNTYFGNILVVLTEAVENAMKHGNSYDPSKNVEITFTSKAEGLSFIIKDEGEGFDISNIPDPTDLNSKADDLKGRGIFCIRTLADEMRYFDGGKSIEIIFKISSINSEMALDRISKLKQYSIGVKETASSENRNQLS